MTAELRELRPEDSDALRGFFADVPSDDRTFFKEDISDAARAGERWIAEQRSVRRLSFEGDGAVVAFHAVAGCRAHETRRGLAPAP